MNAPPDDLTTDPSHRIFRCLALPFGEPVVSGHEHAGKIFGWGDCRLPTPGTAVPVNLDHDPDQVVGHIVESVKTQNGIWCSIKLGDRGASLIAAGHTGISPEVDDRGNLIALALCFEADPSMPSARLIDTPPASPAARISATVPSFPPIGLGSGTAPAASSEFKSALAWGQVGESKTIIGNGGKASDSGPAEWRAPSMFAGRPVLLTPDPDLEVATARRRFEEAREARKEWDSWPASMYRRMQADYAELCRQQEASRAAEQRRKAELARDAELMAGIASIMAPQPKRWRQWWRS